MSNKQAKRKHRALLLALRVNGRFQVKRAAVEGAIERLRRTYETVRHVQGTREAHLFKVREMRLTILRCLGEELEAMDKSLRELGWRDLGCFDARFERHPLMEKVHENLLWCIGVPYVCDLYELEDGARILANYRDPVDRYSALVLRWRGLETVAKVERRIH